MTIKLRGEPGPGAVWFASFSGLKGVIPMVSQRVGMSAYSWSPAILGPAFVGLVVLGGCRQFGNTEAGALVGTGLGATAGAIIGGESGHAAGGALIGAAAGAVTGGLAGNAVDAREERDAAVAHAQYAQAQASANARALSSGDVVAMTQNGVSDDVIVSSLQTRGCRFSGDPQSIIQLKQSGVSDRVIQAMHTSGVSAPYAAPAAPATVVYTPGPRYYGPPPPPVVYVGPGYGPGYWGPRRSWRHHPYGW